MCILNDFTTTRKHKIISYDLSELKGRAGIRERKGDYKATMLEGRSRFSMRVLIRVNNFAHQVLVLNYNNPRLGL
jgi:hypothetical protein